MRVGEPLRGVGQVTGFVVEALECRRLLSALTIAQENQLPGTPQNQWWVQGSGDPTLQGFTTDISVNQGARVDFKISDTASAPYHLDIFRMGYYGGDGARLVTTLESSQTLDQVQPAPVSDSKTGLVDCGNWAVSASWNVPVDATSGIYFARAVRDDTGGASLIFFVVRNDASHSDLLVKTSDSTWQAYNNFGGNSLYAGKSEIGVNRAVKVSYNRPIIGQAGTAYYIPLAFEYPMVRFLEANGYDASYFTDVDTDRYGSLIQNHKVFVAMGHDEYWTAAERGNVETARDAGVNLAFFDGNEIAWKTRWEPSIDGSNTPDRTLVCYKETLFSQKLDPLDPPVWTGLWSDARFSPPADGGRPQNALTGTQYISDFQQETGITVTSDYSGLRFWRNTRIAHLAAGQSLVLTNGALGPEFDSDVDNGFRPAGLFDVASTTLQVGLKIWGVGYQYISGPATWNATLYRAPSGALVFGAGTICWSWGLDSNHLLTPAVTSRDMQQATVNLLADMGTQPATLMTGLTPATQSTDTTPPVSTITPPAPDATAFARQAFTITGTAMDSGGGVVAAVEVSIDGGATWHRASGTSTWSYVLYPPAAGTVTVLTRAVDDSGNLETPSPGLAIPVLASNVAGNTAVLLRTDTSTEGSWQGTYGAGGYVLADGEASYPPFAQPLAWTGSTAHTYTSTTTDPRAMQQSSGAGRVAAVWFGRTMEQLDLNLTDGQPHNVGLYFLDWDHQDRTQTVAVSDADGGFTLAPTTTVSHFATGEYLVYRLTGHVRITIIGQGHSAVLSGVFFDQPNAATVSLLRGDANLDGKVDFADLVILARNYGSSNATWTLGDFNGDGTVGFDDLVTLAQHYQAAVGAKAAALIRSKPFPAARTPARRRHTR